MTTATHPGEAAELAPGTEHLDMAHAVLALAAEDAELRQAPLAKPCRCARPAGEVADRRCLWCGRSVLG